MTTESNTDDSKTTKIQHHHYLTVRPQIDENLLPFVGEARYKAKSGKYQRKTHYWHVKNSAGAIECLQYAVDFMDMIKTNQCQSQAARLIWHISHDMGDLYSSDWWGKHEFLEFIGVMLQFAAKHCDYGLYAEKRLEQLLESEFHNPKQGDS